MPKSLPMPDRVRLNDPTDLAAAVPHLLGFHPADSVVAIALRGQPRERLSFSMRLDLLDPAYDAETAEATALRMAHAHAESVMLCLYTDFPGRDGDLPRRALVEAMQDALDVPLREALLVDDGRVWSYLCDDVHCCPSEGRLLQPNSPGALALAAAHALHGNVVLPSREALVATTAAVAGVTAESMLQAIARVDLDELDPDDDQLLDALCERISDSSGALSHDEAASMVVLLHDVVFRDRVISRLVRRDETLERLVAVVARLAQPPYDAPAAAVLALSAYLRGEGVVAGAAAERALATDADYSLAQLVLDCLAAQLDPANVSKAWRAVDLP